MNLYKLARNRNGDWHYYGYTHAIVSAASEQEARLIHPSGNDDYAWMNGEWMFKTSSGVYVVGDRDWRNPNDLKVEFIGTTHIPKGVVLASFNAV